MDEEESKHGGTSSADEIAPILSPEWRKNVERKLARSAARRAARYAKKPEPDTRLVAWIDILGFGHELENAKTPEAFHAAYQKVLRVQEHFGYPAASENAREQREANRSYGRSVTTISDALLVTANLTGAASNIMTPYDQLLSFIGDLISAQTACALSGIFLRGGICVGKFYHERDILLSPALVHAHRLETKVAVYPIIVIEKKLVDELQALGGIERYAPGYAPSLAYFREFESPAQPSEGLFHLDYGRSIAEEDFGFFTAEDRKAYFDDARPPKERDRIFNESHIPGTDFGALDSETAKEVEKAHGFGLNWGSLVRLSKACEIGRMKFGDEWPTKFKGQLTNPKDHLSIVEEILWLGLWQQTRALEREARPFHQLGHTKRVDWRFDCCGQIINLEIKYRPRDWIRHVDGSEFSRVFDSYYHDVPAKFPTRNQGELNIVGISSLAAEDRHWSLVTEKLLKTHTEIDAVILWAHHTESGGPFRIHSLKKDFIELFFTGGTVEDAAHFGLVRHLWRSRDERRAMRAEEAIPILVRQLQAEQP